MRQTETKKKKLLEEEELTFLAPPLFSHSPPNPNNNVENEKQWMVRIGGGEFPGIREDDYMGEEGQYRVDSGASRTMLNSLMYKLSYYRFADAAGAAFGRRGYDRVRNAEIGESEFSLKYFEEVFTSQHWLMRVYRVRDPSASPAPPPKPPPPALPLPPPAPSRVTRARRCSPRSWPP